MPVLRFITVVLVALSMGMALCHLLESPIRLAYPPQLWVDVTVVQGTYAWFGPPAGAVIEGAAWIAATALAIFAWVRGQTRVLTTLAAVLMISAQMAWWLWVNPANAALAAAEFGAVPDGFDALRRQWEYTHAARAVLQIAALACVAASAELAGRGRH